MVHFRKIIMNIRSIRLEMIIWIVGLVFLATLDPGAQHLSICPLKNIGLEFCPGCGLGHSIMYLFHGEWSLSVQEHPLGIFALFILSYRIFILGKLSLNEIANKKLNYEQNI